MLEFDYIKANTVEAACDLLSIYKTKAALIAGGTDLMVELRANTLPRNLSYLIDVGNIDEMRQIRIDDETVRIGANVTHAEIAGNRLLKQYVPILAEASKSVGSPQIRNRGTIAGNIVTASPCADTVPVLVALDARVKLQKRGGRRELLISDFIEKPYTVKRESDELVTEIVFDKPSPASKGAFFKLIRRKAVAKSRMAFAVLAVQEDENSVKDLRICAGSLTPMPRRFHQAEHILLGKKPTAALIEQSAKQVTETMIERTGYRWSTEYKEPVARAIIKRILKQILEV